MDHWHVNQCDWEAPLISEQFEEKRWPQSCGRRVVERFFPRIFKIIFVIADLDWIRSTNMSPMKIPPFYYLIRFLYYFRFDSLHNISTGKEARTFTCFTYSSLYTYRVHVYFTRLSRTNKNFHLLPLFLRRRAIRPKSSDVKRTAAGLMANNVWCCGRPSGNLASLTNGQFASCLYSMQASLLKWCVCAERYNIRRNNIPTRKVMFRIDYTQLSTATRFIFSWHFFGHHIVMAFFLFFDINSIQAKELLFVFQELLLMDVWRRDAVWWLLLVIYTSFIVACWKIEKWSLMGLCICARLT